MTLDDTGRDHFRTFRRDGGSSMCGVRAAIGLFACRATRQFQSWHKADVPSSRTDVRSREDRRRFARRAPVSAYDVVARLDMDVGCHHRLERQGSHPPPHSGTRGAAPPAWWREWYWGWS